jgi:2-methylcitrate dehydratase PrpD
VLQLKTKKGESRTVEVFYPKGHPKNRMSAAEVEEKFRGCARKLLSEAQQSKIISLVNNLDGLGDAGELMKELAVDQKSMRY